MTYVRSRTRLIPMLLTTMIIAMVVSATSMAAQATVNLGSTASFAVLAGTTITNTGSTKITGDVGLYPGTAFPGQAGVTLSGAIHLNDGVARVAKDDLVTAYNDAAGRTPVTRVPTQLGGTTLKPGVYDSAAGTFQITGTLTLDAEGDPNGVFIFLTDSTLITASGSRVNNINGARFCRIFWKVGSSATLGTNSHFVGHIFALTSIAAQTGATIQGQLLARNGAVTLDSNTITNGECTVAPTPAPTASATIAGTSAGTSGGAGTQTGATTANLPDNTDIPKTGESGSGSMLPFGLLLIILGGLSLAFGKSSRRHEEPVTIRSNEKQDKK